MIKLSFSNLFRRKARTFLSISGIIIGVAAIIVLVSLVDGFTQDFDAVIGQFKGIMVYQKGASDQTVSRVDASLESDLESMPNVKAAIPEIWFFPKRIDSKDVGFESLSVPQVYGLDIAEYYSTGTSGWLSDIEAGSSLKSSDRGQVLIGKKIESDFKKFVGSPIKIDGKSFKVKGILAGSSDFMQGMIIMNMDDARDLSPLPNDKVSSYTVTLTDPTKDKAVANLIRLKFGEDVTAYTQAELSDQFTGIIGNLRLLAILVALVSSIIAGIGIANTMLMSVLERFKEIGALKAVGWTEGNIIQMVLFESFFLGVIGGLLGIAFGYVVDIALSQFAGVKYYISPVLLISTFLFAVCLGLVSGIYPAYRASRLDPVEALRG